MVGFFLSLTLTHHDTLFNHSTKPQINPKHKYTHKQIGCILSLVLDIYLLSLIAYGYFTKWYVYMF
jgi:hypothetical protein